MYPLNVFNASLIGFAVANDEQEHARLSDIGYEPKMALAEPEADPASDDGAGHTVESLRAQLDAAGIPYDKRFGAARLLSLLPA
jgi:hypothetical protein